MKNTGPLMGAKLKSKTHLLDTFFDFFSRFLRVWLQSLKKVLMWPKKIFVGKKLKKVSKTHAPKKVISKTSLTSFFWCVFSNIFQRIRNQREILRFLKPFFIFSEKNFVGHITVVLFSNFDCKCAGNGPKKNVKSFYMNVS
jgi:hypothetical protein